MIYCSIISKARDWEWPKCLLNEDWLSELSYSHKMKHYTDVTKNVKHEFKQKALQDIFSKKCKIKKSFPPIFL